MAHEHDLQRVVGLDATPGSEHDALERRVDEVHGDAGLVGEAARARASSIRFSVP